MSIQSAREAKGNIANRQSAKTPLRFRPVIIALADDSFKVVEYGYAVRMELTDFIVR